MRTTSIRAASFFLLLFFCFGTIESVRSQSLPEEEAYEFDPCGHSADIRDPIIEEAERSEFNVRFVSIVGNTYTRYREFGKRMYQSEGDIFTREKLERTVKRISKMRSIYPINMDNIEVRLDRNNGYIDIVFCVKQKPKNK